MLVVARGVGRTTSAGSVAPRSGTATRPRQQRQALPSPAPSYCRFSGRWCTEVWEAAYRSSLRRTLVVAG